MLVGDIVALNITSVEWPTLYNAVMILGVVSKNLMYVTDMSTVAMAGTKITKHVVCKLSD